MKERKTTMFKRFDNIYGIDLGSSNTVIFERGRGVVLSEPSVVAVDGETGALLAVGEQARSMIGRAPEHVVIDYPLRNGVIANFEMTGSMLKTFMKKIQGRSSLWRSMQVRISVPCGITSVQKRAVEEAMLQTGARRAVAVEEPLAAAIGAGLPIAEPVGRLVLDIGGGTSQAAVLSLGGIVASRTLPRGGLSIDRDIMDFVKRRYNVEIGERTAEEIKVRIATASASAAERAMEIRGRDAISGLPRAIRLSSRDVSAIVEEFLQSIVEAIRSTIEACPPELAGDVVEQGIMLCGGGALLEGIDERLRSETNIPVYIAEQPLECTAIGTGAILSCKAP